MIIFFIIKSKNLYPGVGFYYQSSVVSVSPQQKLFPIEGIACEEGGGEELLEAIK